MSYILDALKKSESEREAALAANNPAMPDQPATPLQPRFRWQPVTLSLLIAGSITVLALANYQSEPVSPSHQQAEVPAQESAPQPLVTAPSAGADAPKELAAIAMPTAQTADTEFVEENSPAAEAMAEDATIPSLFELPEEIRLQIPSIVIEGHFFDENPAKRMVVINGAVQKEGRSFANGQLVLESISPESITLGFGDNTFTMSVYDSWNGNR